MLEFAEFQNNATTIVERLEDLDSNQSSFVNFFTSCLPQLSNKFAMEDANTIELVAAGLDKKYNDQLLAFARSSIYPPVQNIEELNIFKTKVLLGIYLKVWSNYKSTVFYYLNQKIIELLQHDLGVRSPLDLDSQLIESSLTALSHFASFVCKRPDHQVYKSIDDCLGVDIQAQIHSIRSSMLSDKNKLSTNGSWTWFDSYSERSTQRNVELFKEAMENKQFFATINASEQNQSEFIRVMDGNKFTSNDLLELIAAVSDTQVKSLLIVNLLCKQEYFFGLGGESFIAHVNRSTVYKPARLNELLYHFDVSILSEEMIAKLDPEAAYTLLCSVPHFQKLQDFQVQALLKRYPKITAIRYWLQNYASMPNAHFMLAHLLHCVKKQMLQEIASLDPSARRALGGLVIKNWHLFQPDSELFDFFVDEESLNLAIYLFLNGNNNETNIEFIKYSIPILIAQNHQFSLETIHLLFALYGKSEFKEMNEELGYLHRFMHQYKSCPQELNQTLNHYFNRFSRIDSELKQQKSIQQLSLLLADPSLDVNNKNALFSALLNYPNVYDETVIFSMMQFDPVRFIKHFGFIGGEEGYQKVLELCTWGITKLDANEHASTISVLMLAQKEAEQELAFIKEYGFFSAIMQFLTRCTMYGWTGFFKPKLPTYVAPSYILPVKIDSDLEPHSLNFRFISLPKLEQRLNYLIAKIKKEYNFKDLNQLMLMLDYYSLKSNHIHEFDIRLEIDKLMIQLSHDCSSNPSLYGWYMQHELAIRANRHRVAEMMLDNSELENLQSLLSDKSLPFQCLPQLESELLTYSAEAFSVNPNVNTADKAEVVDGKSGRLFDTISSYANNIWTLFSTSKLSQRNSMNEEIAQSAHGLK